MSEQEQSIQPVNGGEADAQAAKPARSSNYLGSAALVMAVLAGVVVVVLWSDVREMRRESSGAEQQLRTSVSEMQQWAQEQRSSLSAEDQQLAARLATVEQGVQSLREQLARDRVEWLVAETDYLLRVANRRVQLERDVRGALIALRSADALLAEGNNPLYLPVRAKLSEEIHALEVVPKVDVEGIALELSAISRQVESMPLATARRAIAEYQAGPQESIDADASWFSRLLHGMWNDVKGLVTIRRLDQKIQPLLLPEQRYFLAQNLRLRLEDGRHALLRGDNALYQEDLQVAAQWLDDYFDSDDSAVRDTLVTVRRLAKVNIAPPLPEMGGSLALLDKIRAKNGSGRSKQP